MTIQEAYKHLSTSLSAIYETREATAIASLVVTHITGLNNTGRLLQGTKLLSLQQQADVTQYLTELLTAKPVQYVLHEAWFGPLRLDVNEHVLIPRPETEELVQWILQDLEAHTPLRLLDIGTGSGCIPLLLQHRLPGAEIHALDISADALAVARKNAATLQLPVHFHHIDILDKTNGAALPSFDCIVSNPPYITYSEKQEMHDNVLAHEPHLALFVPDEDPLLFYKAIAAFALEHLKQGGQLYLEINEALGKETTAMLEDKGFTNVALRKDMQGKDRMIKAGINPA